MQGLCRVCIRIEEIWVQAKSLQNELTKAPTNFPDVVPSFSGTRLCRRRNHLHLTDKDDARSRDNLLLLLLQAVAQQANSNSILLVFWPQKGLTPLCRSSSSALPKCGILYGVLFPMPKVTCLYPRFKALRENEACRNIVLHPPFSAKECCTWITNRRNRCQLGTRQVPALRWPA